MQNPYTTHTPQTAKELIRTYTLAAEVMKHEAEKCDLDSEEYKEWMTLHDGFLNIRAIFEEDMLMEEHQARQTTQTTDTESG